MLTQGIGAQGSSGNSLGQAAGSAASQISGDEFMKLLLTQLKNQDPLDPMKDADFAAQLAQFSSLQQMQSLNNSFKEMLMLQELTQGANLVGKTITYAQPGSTAIAQGVVDSVSIADGKLQLLVGGTPVTLDQVRGVTQPRTGSQFLSGS